MRCQLLTANYRQLQLRPEIDFERILLEQIGFSRKEVVKDQGRSGEHCMRVRLPDLLPRLDPGRMPVISETGFAEKPVG